MTPDGLQGWLAALTPILESKVLALLILLGVCVMLYVVADGALERHRATITLLSGEIRTLHERSLTLALQAGKCAP